MEPEERTDSEKEPPALPYRTIGIIYNLKHRDSSSAVRDEEAEFDDISTVHAIRDVFVSHGLKTVLLEANAGLMDQLKTHPIDFAFNIAEGIGGRCREALVPAIMEYLDIPCSGSDAAALCMALDKGLCKRLVSSYGIPTAGYAVLKTAEDCQNLNLSYPLIVKPNAEGSSKGISEACIAENQQQLEELLQNDFSLYQEEMLAEEYLPGREFTVGLLGNGESLQVFRPMEISYQKNTQGSYRIYSYQVKQHFREYVSYACPAEISASAEKKMMQDARTVFNALGCFDFARVDFRMNAAGIPCFIEANPLPGLAPGYSDYPMAAQFLGRSYDETVYDVLKTACIRTASSGGKGKES